jgi:putative DNA primase/helicase
MEALSAEREGILAWMVAGSVQALRDGLRAPAEVTRATRDYLAQEDHFGQWLQTRKRCSAANGEKASALLIAFLAWARAEGGDNFAPPSQKAFGLELVRRGIEKRIGEQGTFYGLMLPDPFEDQY